MTGETISRFPANQWMRLFVLGVLACLAAASPAPAVAGSAVVYVDASATGAVHDGTDWSKAFTSIQPAIDAAAAGGGAPVWVARGVYRENLILKSNVALYGGFAGGETDLAERDLKTLRSVIASRSGAVTVLMDTVTSAVLDGFTITGCSTVGGAGVLFRHADASSQLVNCAIGGNFGSSNIAGIRCDAASPSILNCVVGGNAGGGLLAYNASAPKVVGCTFSDNGGASGGAVVGASGGVSLYNTIVANTFGGRGVSGAVTASHCLFFQNSQGDGIATGNACIFVSPGFVMAGAGATTGTWTADPVYDAASDTTRFFDDRATLAPGALAGRTVQPYEGDWLQGAILDNTTTSVLVAGDFSGLVFAGDLWRLADYHLTNGSKALDAGTTATMAATDYEGDSRPGGDGLTDIGADEAPDAYSPQPDLLPPDSSVHPLAEVTTSTLVNITWSARDAVSGVRDARLFYRRNGGSWTPWGVILSAPPVQFDVEAAGGDGLYEFYTVATDEMGNTEEPPAAADARTLVVTSFSGARIYVDAAAAGERTGRSWNDALGEIGLGLSLAAAYHVPEIWVAGGVYRERIVFRSPVALYGGFAGVETMLAKRDLKARSSLIDGLRQGSTVTIDSVNGSVLDGFTVTRGRTTDPDAPGAGIFLKNLTEARIANCIVSDNQASWYGGGIGCVNAAPCLENCVIGGNDAYVGGGLYVAGSRAPAVLNCTFSDNLGWDKCAVADTTGLVTPVNSIFSYNLGGPALDGVAGASHSLFFGNPDGDGIAPGGDNLFVPPGFVMDDEDAIGGTWTQDPFHDPVSDSTRLWDAEANLVPGALAGRVVQLYIGSWVQAAVLDNTTTSVLVAGNHYNDAYWGDPWRVVDYHLADGSKALDRGTTESYPLVDIDGDPRPGGDSRIDIGADEASAEFLPLPDTDPPVSSVGPLPVATTTAMLELPLAAFDGESGLLEVRIFYRRNGGAWTLYGAPVTSGPVHIDTTSIGGDGLYEFYSVAVDLAGNAEAVPASPDASTRVVTSYLGARIYVDAAATGAPNGQSWGNAFHSIQLALDLAAAYGVPEIWVARGVYHENLTFRSGVALYGGFAGGETELAQRRLKAGRCLIVARQTGNAVTMDGVSNTRLDGFTIAGGVAESALGFGSGIRCRNVDGTCRIANCVIGGNQTNWYGGGIGCSSAAPVIENCLIGGNSANGKGAGIYIEGSRAPLIVNCTIAGNKSNSAPALYDDTGLVRLKNSIIASNQGSLAVRTDGEVSSCLFFNNPGGSGVTLGGTNLAGNPCFVMDGSGATTGTWTAGPVYDSARNTTAFLDANAALSPGALAGRLLEPNRANPRQVAIVDNTTTCVLVAGNWTGAAFAGTSWRLADYHPTFGSAAVDTGGLSDAPAVDLEGSARPVDIAGHGAAATGTEYDVGALEAQPEPRARLTAPARQIDFGGQMAGAGPTPPRSVIVANDGFLPLAFSGPGFALTGADAADFAFATPPSVTPLAPGETRSVSLVFNPGLEGSKRARLLVTTGDMTSSTFGIDLVGLALPGPPRILEDPVAIVVNPGESATFRVTAGSPIPLRYQWKKNGVDLSNGGGITGADGATLTIDPVAGSDAGDYACEVCNASGQKLSKAARLTVNPVLTVFSVHGVPTPGAGTRAFTTASLVRAWVGGSPEVDTTGTTRHVAMGWTGTGSVPAAGQTTSTEFSLVQDSSLTWLWKKQYQLTAEASPAGGGRVTFADGATTATGSWHDAASTVTLKAIPTAGWGFAGWSGDATSTAADIKLGMTKPLKVRAVFLMKPVITRQPADQTADSGATARLTVEAAGAGPLGYQWWKDGAMLRDGGRLAGATAATLVIDACQEVDEGVYHCVVTNAVGQTVSASAHLTVNPSLTIISAWGVPSPRVGRQCLASGTMVTASVPAPIVTDAAGTTRRVCTGWTAVGAAPASGSGSSVSFTLDRPTTLTWVWKTQYRLTVQTEPPARGTVTLADGVTAADGWHDAGSSPMLLALPNPGSRFAFWNGCVSGRANPVSLPVMDRPLGVQSRFESQNNGAHDWWDYR